MRDSDEDICTQLHTTYNGRQNSVGTGWATLCNNLCTTGGSDLGNLLQGGEAYVKFFAENAHFQGR